VRLYIHDRNGTNGNASFPHIQRTQCSRDLLETWVSHSWRSTRLFHHIQLCNRFRNGRTDLFDDQILGKIQKSDLTIAISSVFEEYPFLLWKFLSRHFTIAKARYLWILHENLGLQKLHLRWVSHTLDSASPFRNGIVLHFSVSFENLCTENEKTLSSISSPRTSHNSFFIIHMTPGAHTLKMSFSCESSKQLTSRNVWSRSCDLPTKSTTSLTSWNGSHSTQYPLMMWYDGAEFRWQYLLTLPMKVIKIFRCPFGYCISSQFRWQTQLTAQTEWLLSVRISGTTTPNHVSDWESFRNEIAQIFNEIRRALLASVFLDLIKWLKWVIESGEMYYNR
jgi:hypothetical protein